MIAWYLHQLDHYGLGPVLAVEAAALIAALCATGATWEAIDRQREKRRIRRDIRHLEHQINNPAVRAMYLDPTWKEEDKQP